MDTTTIINLLISGTIGVIFGVISGWVTYRYQRRLDIIAWEREQERESNQRLRDGITQGLEDPLTSIHKLRDLSHRLQTGLAIESEKRFGRFRLSQSSQPDLSEIQMNRLVQAASLVEQIEKLLDEIQQSDNVGNEQTDSSDSE